MSYQVIQSELVVDLSTEEQQLLSGGGKKDKRDDDADEIYEKDKDKDYRKIPIIFKGFVIFPEDK